MNLIVADKGTPWPLPAGPRFSRAQLEPFGEVTHEVTIPY